VKISKRAALMLGIGAGYALLIIVFAATKTIDRSAVATLAACFVGWMAAIVPLLNDKRGTHCGCRWKSQAPR